MKTDLYTKAVLTLIAASLIYICVTRNGTSARADGPLPVLIVGVGEDGKASLPVGLVGTRFEVDSAGGRWLYEPIPVRVVPENSKKDHQK